MKRTATLALIIATLLPAAGALAMASSVPPSAYVVPTISIAAPGEPIRLTPAVLGVRRADDGLQVDRARLDAAIEMLAKRFDVPGKPGSYALMDDQRNVVLKPGTPGIGLDRQKTEAVLLRALRTGGTGLRLPMAETPAPPPPHKAIVVNLSEFRLELFESTAMRRHYEVGVGALRYATPPGVYFVRSKAKNPTWRNPGSAWARSMPSYIGPGPRNPLGTRALRLDRGALVIHGTPQPWTIGRRSSHGCIRMRRADVEVLFEDVPVGTPVFIVP